jgi:hypothetical protein
MSLAFQPLLPASAALEADSGSTYSLTADAGILALTGQDNGLLYSRRVPSSSGSLSVSGQDTGLKRTSKLSASSGIYNFTGQAIAYLSTLKLSASTGSFSLDGQQVALRAAWHLPAIAGGFAHAGQDIAISPPFRVLDASGRLHSLGGQDTALAANRTIGPDKNDFVLSGFELNFILTAGDGPTSRPLNFGLSIGL